MLDKQLNKYQALGKRVEFLEQELAKRELQNTTDKENIRKLTTENEELKIFQEDIFEVVKRQKKKNITNEDI